MPFESEKQRRYLWKNEPEVAREFAAKEKKMGGHKKYMELKSKMPKSHLRISKKQHEELMRGYKSKP